MPRALVSVSDKRGIVPFVQGLVDLGWEVISTGGTAAALKASGVPVIPVDQVTGFPEMLDGRVKTLHPAIHGGILARRELAEHRAAIARHGIGLIDLVAVNLYPFQDTVARPDVIFEDAIENIDIGGPSMLRSAAKNHAQVIPVVDPVDYPAILGMLRGGGVSQEARRELAAKVFAHLADYDSAIARYLTPAESGLPGRLGIAMERLMPLRYGENPDQRAALYVTEEPRGMRDLAQRHGKELSFNNLLDIDAAMQAVSTWDSRIACCIVKHTTPCGIAVATTMVVDGLLAFVVIWKMWKWPLWKTTLMLLPFTVVDLTFFSANFLKLFEGAWAPLLFGATMVLLILTWRRGSKILVGKTRRTEVPSHTDFLAKAKRVLEVVRAELPPCCRGNDLVGQ